ncbi:MAG: glycosyltransferase [Bacillales bacterium]
MKKIYWFVNQFYKVGGSEIVSLNDINILANDYEINVVLLSSDDINYDQYKIKYNLNITRLNISPLIIRNEDYLKKSSLLTKIKVYFKVSNFILFKKFKYRRMIKKMVNKEDILIYSSPFSYMIAPKKYNNIFHFHYNSIYLNKFLNRVVINFLANKPKLKIVLTKETKEKYKHNKKELIEYIYNPSRVMQVENFDVEEKPELLFFARYEKQKRPLVAIETLILLSHYDPYFKCHFYGGGYYYKEMVKIVKDNKLENNIIIHNGFVNPDKILTGNKILIMTSLFEGFPLNIIETSSRSIPTVLMNYGDGANELVINNKTGIIVPQNDKESMANALYKVLHDKKLLLDLKINAFEHSLKFSESEIRKSWLKILKNLD